MDDPRGRREEKQAGAVGGQCRHAAQPRAQATTRSSSSADLDVPEPTANRTPLPTGRVDASAFLRYGSAPPSEASVIDHVSLPVRDLDRSLALYLAALAPLGYRLMRRGEGYAGLESGGVPDFWLMVQSAGARVHVAFRAPDRAGVEAFHAAALRAGGTDNGPPGLRPQYHPGYYGAFVLDPDGHNAEVVFHDLSLAPG